MAPLGAFTIELCGDAMFESLTLWEISLLEKIQEIATPLGSFLWTAITTFGEAGIFWIVLSLLLMIFPKTRKAGFSMGLALLFGVILGNGVLKNVVARPRPYDFSQNLSHRLFWGEMSKDFSFPSGHTLASFEAATALFLHHRKWGIAALVLAFFVSISRLFLLVHYPSDLIAGAVLGILFALASSKIVAILWKKYEAKETKI